MPLGPLGFRGPFTRQKMLPSSIPSSQVLQSSRAPAARACCFFCSFSITFSRLRYRFSRSASFCLRFVSASSRARVAAISRFSRRRSASRSCRRARSSARTIFNSAARSALSFSSCSFTTEMVAIRDDLFFGASSNMRWRSSARSRAAAVSVSFGQTSSPKCSHRYFSPSCLRFFQCSANASSSCRVALSIQNSASFCGRQLRFVWGISGGTSRYTTALLWSCVK